MITREEADRMLWMPIGPRPDPRPPEPIVYEVNVTKTLDKIFKDIESQTCENCKYRSEVHSTTCTHTDNYTFDWMEIPYKTFNCPKHEIREVR